MRPCEVSRWRVSWRDDPKLLMGCSDARMRTLCAMLVLCLGRRRWTSGRGRWVSRDRSAADSVGPPSSPFPRSSFRHRPSSPFRLSLIQSPTPSTCPQALPLVGSRTRCLVLSSPRRTGERSPCVVASASRSSSSPDHSSTTTSPSTEKIRPKSSSTTRCVSIGSTAALRWTDQCFELLRGNARAHPLPTSPFFLRAALSTLAVHRSPLIPRSDSDVLHQSGGRSILQLLPLATTQRSTPSGRPS